MNMKRKVKRKYLCVVWLCFMLLGLAACTRAGDGDGTESKEYPVFENFSFEI